MDKPCWTINRIRDALRELGPSHQQAFITSLGGSDDQQRLMLTVRATQASQPEELVWGPDGRRLSHT